MGKDRVLLEADRPEDGMGDTMHEQPRTDPPPAVEPTAAHPPPAGLPPPPRASAPVSAANRQALLVAGALVLVLVLAAVFLLGRASTSPGEPRAEDTTAAPPTTEYVPVTRQDTPEERERVEMETAARKMVNAWLTRGTADERRAAMAPYGTKELVDRLVCYGSYGTCLDDPGLLPKGRPVAPPEMATKTDGGYALYSVRLTDNRLIGLNMIYRDGRWIASDLTG